MKPLLHQPDGKQVKILCGVSGSGKTTYAKQLTADFMRVDDRLFSIVSADNYFLNEKGDYQFKASELSKAHNACFRSFIAGCLTDIPLIIVDNTNTSIAEISPYVLAGESYGYRVEIIYLSCDLDIAYNRNIHNLSKASIEIQSDRLAKTFETCPPWWNIQRKRFYLGSLTW